MTLLSDNQIRDGVAGLDGWILEGDEIVKEYSFDSFAESIAFVTAVAGLAEQAEHHPDIDIRYDRVRLALSTHSEGGLTSRDLELARRIDENRAGRTGA